MEIKELRIGNLVKWGIHECLIKGIHTDTVTGKDPYVYGSVMIGAMPIYTIEGIELTPEWLERAKFQLVDETMAIGVEGIKGPYYAKDALLLWSNGSEPKSAYLVFYADGFFGKYKAVRGRWIHTVHDLQNTYHAWKGEELAIDKTSPKN